MEAKIKSYQEKETFERNGVSFVCSQTYQIGPDGEDFVDAETSNLNLLARQDAYRKATNLLTSSEIKEIRKNYHLSQKDFGQILGLGQIDIVRYETKAVQNRSINDLILRAKEDPLWFFEKFKTVENNLTLDKALEVREAIAQYSQNKGVLQTSLRNRIDYAYLPYQGQSDKNGGKELSIFNILSIIALGTRLGIFLYKTKAAKLLFFCDFLTQKETGHGLTGLIYSHTPYGALPLDFDDILSWPGIEKKEEVFYPGEDKESVSTLISSKAKNILLSQDTERVERVLKAFSSFSSAEISSYMHEEEVYQHTKMGQILSYDEAKRLRDLPKAD